MSRERYLEIKTALSRAVETQEWQLHIEPADPSEKKSMNFMQIQELIVDYDGCTAHLTGVYYDARCLLHQDDEDESVEKPARCSEIWRTLKDAGIIDRCRRIPSRMATKEEICSIHTAPFYRKIRDTKLNSVGANRLARDPGSHLDEEKDTYINDFSFDAASLSAGGLIDLTSRVVEGSLKNGFAIIRPPGHHAENCKAMGFCLFNHIAITAKLMLERYKEKVSKILIVDWDVHHGNGTQKSFESDPNVLYFSIHRYDNGSFFPGSGKISSVGKGGGIGKTINVPLPCSGFGDTEYIQIFEQVLMPVAREYQPDLILVSAGFDCAYGDIGEMRVTENGFAQMASLLVNTNILYNGKVVVALEGGYNLKSLVLSAMATVKVLLGDPASCVPCVEDTVKFLTWTERKRQEINTKRFSDMMARVITEQSRYWSCFQSYLPPETRKTRQQSNNDARKGAHILEDNYNKFKQYVVSTTFPRYASLLGRKVQKPGKVDVGVIVERQFIGGQSRWSIQYSDGMRTLSHVNMLKLLIEEEEPKVAQGNNYAKSAKLVIGDDGIAIPRPLSLAQNDGFQLDMPNIEIFIPNRWPRPFGFKGPEPRYTSGIVCCIPKPSRVLAIRSEVSI
ncbi:hypothetical protein AAMO2058_000924000 [Amorphochlora amoebiformis]